MWTNEVKKLLFVLMEPTAEEKIKNVSAFYYLIP